MALNRKYAALPDLDSAPDIYETPELTDDVSTVPTTTIQSHSDREIEDEEDTPGISRSRLRISDARSRFEPANIDAGDVNFSDRLDVKRKSYKASTRHRKIWKDGTEELGDLSDEDDDNLRRKIARFKRQLEEVKEEINKRDHIAEEELDEKDLEQFDELMTLSSTLDHISVNIMDGKRRKSASASARLLQSPAADDSDNQPQLEKGSATYTITYAPNYQQTHALMKAADFDRRLTLLEKTIGIGSSTLPELESISLPRAIMPTLDTLQKKISMLSEASVASLDSITRRARTLTQEADNLTKARQSAKHAKEALDECQVPHNDPNSESTEQATKINALYGTLPTIEGLAPLLPPLLDRLRSLRAIHADAARAGETLGRIEARQLEITEDIKIWKEGLESVEKAIEEGETAMNDNKKVIERWVKDLEERLKKLE